MNFESHFYNKQKYVKPRFQLLEIHPQHSIQLPTSLFPLTIQTIFHENSTFITFCNILIYSSSDIDIGKKVRTALVMHEIAARHSTQRARFTCQIELSNVSSGIRTRRALCVWEIELKMENYVFIVENACNDQIWLIHCFPPSPWRVRWLSCTLS